MSTEALLDHLRGMVDRKLLRRVAAILYHRRAGFSANGMGVWRVPEERDPRDRHADGRGARDLALLRAPDLRGLALLASSRWPTAARRRSATRSWSRSPTSTTCTAPTAPILYSSTEFKKIRLHYFTRRLRRAGRRSTRRPRHPYVGGPLPRGPSGCMPGGVNSPGARDALDRARLPDLHRARRGLRADRRRRQPLRRLGLLLGPADPRPRRSGVVVEARRRRGGERHELRRADRGRGRARGRGLRPLRLGRDGPDGQLGHRGDDERGAARPGGDRPRASWSSSRAPTTATSTGCSPRPARASPRRASRPAPGSPRRRRRTTIVVPWNDPEAVERRGRRARGRGDPRRAAAGQHGRGPAGRRASSRSCGGSADEHGALLVLDEVISRLPRRPRRRPGAARRRGRPDDHGQGARRRPAGRGLRRAPRADASGSRRPATSTRPGRCRAIRSRSPPGWRRWRSSTAPPTSRLAASSRSGWPTACGRRPATVRCRLPRVPGLVTPFFSAEPVRDFAGASRLRPRRLRPLLPGAARPRRLPARLAVRGLVRLARPRRGGDRAHLRGGRGGVRGGPRVTAADPAPQALEGARRARCATRTR